MKKLLLLCCVGMCVTATEAQTGKPVKKSKNKQVDYTALTESKIESAQALRQVKIDSMIVAQQQADAARHLNDSVQYAAYLEQRRIANEAMERKADSLNREQGKQLSIQHSNTIAVETERKSLGKKAKLNPYQVQQVNFINQVYFTKAEQVKTDSLRNDTEKKAALAKLNDERVARLKTVLGKSKEKKLEKARKTTGNSKDTELQWVNEIDGVAKS